MNNILKEKIIELLKSYEDNFENRVRHPNREFFDFTNKNSGGDFWELGNRSGKYAMYNRLTNQIMDLIKEQEE